VIDVILTYVVFQKNNLRVAVLPAEIADACSDYEENNKQLRLTMALFESMSETSETSEHIAGVLTKASNIISNILSHNNYSREIMKACSLRNPNPNPNPNTTLTLRLVLFSNSNSMPRSSTLKKR